jgi:Na+-transporting NADH:ubiquinone oxidoreductase subunit NqrA
MNNNRAWIHSLFKERHQFGEYHHRVSCTEEAPKDFFFGYLRMSFDIYDYILS